MRVMHTRPPRSDCRIRDPEKRGWCQKVALPQYQTSRPTTAYTNTPSTIVQPPARTDKPTTRRVAMTATTFSILLSRPRIACTCARTSAPQLGQRPPGRRAMSALHCGQRNFCAIGTVARPCVHYLPRRWQRASVFRRRVCAELLIRDTKKTADERVPVPTPVPPAWS